MILITDPIDLLVDTTGQIVIVIDVQFSRGLPAVVQECRLALQTIRGEWFLDLDEGVPYFERDGVSAAEALIGRYDEDKVLKAFRDALMSVAEVAEIVTLKAVLDKVTRGVRVTWAVRTVFGDTDPNTLLLGVK